MSDEYKRSGNGQFAKGNRGGPGRPKKSVEERYLRALEREVRVKDWQAIVRTIIARAKAGDIACAKFIAEYLIGKPVQRIDQNVGLQGEVGLLIHYVNDWRRPVNE